MYASKLRDGYKIARFFVDEDKAVQFVNHLLITGKYKNDDLYEAFRLWVK